MEIAVSQNISELMRIALGLIFHGKIGIESMNLSSFPIEMNGGIPFV